MYLRWSICTFSSLGIMQLDIKLVDALTYLPLFIHSLTSINTHEAPRYAQDCFSCLEKGQEDPLEKEMATHSSILSWKILRTEDPGRYSPWSHKSWT